jgi:hypothetical protein
LSRTSWSQRHPSLAIYTALAVTTILVLQLAELIGLL